MTIVNATRENLQSSPWHQKLPANLAIFVLIGTWMSGNLLNAATTSIGFARGFVEISPVPKWFLSQGGPAAMWTLKALATLLLPMMLWSGFSNGLISNKGARIGLLLASIAVILAAYREAWMLGLFG